MSENSPYCYRFGCRRWARFAYRIGNRNASICTYHRRKELMGAVDMRTERQIRRQIRELDLARKNGDVERGVLFRVS
jgi:hypothetical protein